MLGTLLVVWIVGIPVIVVLCAWIAAERRDVVDQLGVRARRTKGARIDIVPARRVSALRSPPTSTPRSAAPAVKAGLEPTLTQDVRKGSQQNLQV
jgi:hypothetical protein